MSEPYVSTRSKTCKHLKKFNVFSSLREPETHSGTHSATNKQVHQQAQLKSFKTTITVSEVEHQKTVYKKLGKQTIWFSEVIKEFYHYFQEK